MIRPVEVKPLTDFKLLILFSTGEYKLFDLKLYFDRPFYKPLSDIKLFNQVYVGEFTIEWPNGKDIAPHELYDLSVPISEQVAK